MTLPIAKLAGVLLAAGASTRLGRPKQLIEWRGQTLISRAVANLVSICGAGVTVVTGAHADEVESDIANCKVKLVRNPDWQSGMASSLRAGVNAAAGNTADALLVMLCDQPMVTLDDLVRLTDAWQNQPNCPVAAGYGAIFGVPAIIPAALLPELSALKDDSGARAFLRNRDDVQVVDISTALLDIDTVDDLLQLQEAE
jgi:molybdenum cofactor cytidylyltransferase